MVGGFTANGDAVMPILEAAGIPWFAPPGHLGGRAVQRGQLPDHLRRARPGRARPDGRRGRLRQGRVGQLRPAVGRQHQPARRPGPDQRGPRPVHADQGAADDHRLQRHRAGGQRLRLRRGRHRPAAVPRHRGRRRPARQQTTYYVVPGGLTDAVARSGGESVEGAKSLSNFPDDGDPIWDEGKKYVGDLADEENGGWSALYFSNTWVGYRTLLSLIKNNDDFSAAGIKATLDATTAGRHRRVRAAVQLRRGLPGTGAEPGLQLLRADLRDQGRQARPGRHGDQGHAAGARPRVLTRR